MSNIMNDKDYAELIQSLKTPEKTAWLRTFLTEGETDADIPDAAYLLVEEPVTADDIKWGKEVLAEYALRK